MSVGERAFPIARIPLAERRRQTPGLVPVLVEHVDSRREPSRSPVRDDRRRKFWEGSGVRGADRVRVDRATVAVVSGDAGQVAVDEEELIQRLREQSLDRSEEHTSEL